MLLKKFYSKQVSYEHSTILGSAILWFLVFPSVGGTKYEAAGIVKAVAVAVADGAAVPSMFADALLATADVCR